MELFFSHIWHEPVDLDSEVLDHIVLNQELLNLLGLIHAQSHVFQFAKFLPLLVIRTLQKVVMAK
jgi:hypothetical protein